ncbi:hypothetical protein JET18_21635 [Chryseobacterium sp. L7]|uniref:Tetratricopeptide repeat protein n=1 Tax=Chryseobacterium endalhagicum TaxID=2797638 RepID=A0ABS1QLF2_9FLAO|nr:DUF6584 family protein [Chryseobacterium endalhagicum]MBL1223455.1 hypothetical protein [Chryseobacterium endalhagicum]
MENIFYRIEKDLEGGRKKKACNRLRNLINQFPDDLSLRKKLGQIYFEAGFLDEAGKFWILSEPDDKEMENAVEIYKRSLSYSGNAILKDIVFRGDKNILSDCAQRALKDLENDSLKKTNHIPEYKRKYKQESKDDHQLSFLNKIGIALLIGIIILIPILGIVKLFELIKLLLN